MHENPGVINQHSGITLRVANLLEDRGDVGGVAGIAIVAARHVLFCRKLFQHVPREVRLRESKASAQPPTAKRVASAVPSPGPTPKMATRGEVGCITG